MDIKVKFFDPELRSLYEKNGGISPAHPGEWVDLMSDEDVTLVPGDETKIHFGVAMEIPKGYEAHIAARSSTFKKYGIIMTNGIGIVDNAYCGDNDEWLFPVYCLKDGTIHKGDRIAQFRLFPVQEKVDFKIVDSLGNADRGGFGSTGD